MLSAHTYTHTHSPRSGLTLVNGIYYPDPTILPRPYRHLGPFQGTREGCQLGLQLKDGVLVGKREKYSVRNILVGY